MRRSFWIFAAVFNLAIGVPSAQAVTFTPTFSPASASAGDVSFPSPTIFENWDIVSDSLMLAAGDHPGDTYTWSNSILPDAMFPSELADYTLSITDVTTGDSPSVFGTVGINDLFFMGFGESGTLTFNPVASAVPEPSTWAMMILGFAGIGAMTYRRRKSAMIPG
jgi:PEP-CTERM motif